MRRVLVRFGLVGLSLAGAVGVAGPAAASCVRPPAPHVTPTSVRPGDTLRVTGVQGLCQDVVRNGTPMPIPGPVPHQLPVYLEPDTGRSGIIDPSSAQIGSVPVTRVAADRRSWNYSGTVMVPGSTAPGNYVVAVDDSVVAPLRVLPLAQRAPKTLPFTGRPNVLPEFVVGVMSILVGVFAYAAAGCREGRLGRKP